MSSKDMSAFLDKLVDMVECSYISDLHDARFAKKVIEAVSRVDENDFSPRAWNDVIRYITKQSDVFDNGKDAKAFLLACLRETVY